MFPNYNRLFDPNCKLIFFKYQWLLTSKLSCLSQHTWEMIMSVKTHCSCDLPWRSSLIRVNSFIKDLNLFFSKEVGFCPPCQIKQWAFVQWDIVQWAFVLVGFCPSGLLSVPRWSCTEQRSRTQCKLGPATPRSQVKTSTTEPLRPLCCLKKMQCSFITPVMPYGIASYFTATYVDPASSGSRVIRLPPSMWRECNEPMQPPF